MADGDPIRIGRDNIASNPGAETLLRRAANSTRNDPVFTVRTPVGGDGIHGEASGNRIGVQGRSVSGTGVGGVAVSGRGVRGTSDTGIGVRATSIQSIGVFGDSFSSPGVQGMSQQSNGVDGFSTSGSGVSGFSATGSGASGFSTTGIGVSGNSDFIGVAGSCSGSGAGVRGVSPSGPAVNGISTSGSGVFGFSTSGIGVVGNSNTGHAGVFLGPVEVRGDLTVVNGNKPFKIDHPLDPQNRYLLHNAVESSERKNLYDGVARLDEKGAAWVVLPEWFEALNGDFRYQLTAIGGSAPGLHVTEELSENRFKIGGGVEGVKVCWQVTGVRKDPWAAANRFEVEQEKREEERGRYLEPTLYGAPEERRVIIGPIAEAVEGGRKHPEPLGIDPARLEEERLRRHDEWRRLVEEQDREMEELRRAMEPAEEALPEQSNSKD
jgi:hypothetical protein